jgi:exodeoxyribonuclease V alpha subunit
VLPGCHVLLIGDPYQLPPVGHGAPLRDLIAAGVPTGELTEVRRNAGSIVRACASIKAGTAVEFPDRLDLDAADPLNLRILDCPAEDAVEVLADVLAGMTRFDPRWEAQIITGLNDKSDCSRVKLNERFGRVLNPDGAEARGNRFRVGDKIICTKNTELKAVKLGRDVRGWHQIVETDAARYSEADGLAYVANGELGRVVAVSERHTVARFGGADAPLVRFGNTKKKAEDDQAAGQEGEGAAADFDLAWAITVHRSQGSEWPCVVVMVDDAAAAVADRNWWYTAISRARTACVLIGPVGTFEKQVRRVTVDKRRTFLAELLKEAQTPTPEPEKEPAR